MRVVLLFATAAVLGCMLYALAAFADFGLHIAIAILTAIGLV